MNRRAAWIVIAALLGRIASAAVVPAPPQTELHQRLGESLPPTLRFTDADGAAVRLGDYFGDSRALVLVLGYHRCPNLCGLLMHGVLEALAGSGLPADAYRVLVVSIDPDETAADARARRGVDLDYASFLAGDRAAALPQLQRLVGSAHDVQALAASIGFDYRRDGAASAGASRFVHPSGFVVVTPQRRIARYFFGVRFDAAELRRALQQAAAGGIGTLADRLLLLCAHFDPRLGRHDAAVMAWLRAVGVALAALLGLYAWRHRGHGGRR